jgi:hypothetical protein
MDISRSQKADEYRKLAVEADKRAEAASLAETRELNRQLARNWREMACQLGGPKDESTPAPVAGLKTHL